MLDNDKEKLLVWKQFWRTENVKINKQFLAILSHPSGVFDFDK